VQLVNGKQDVLSRNAFHKKLIRRVLLYITLISFLSGCVMVPKTHEFQEPKCELTTKKLTVDVVGLDVNDLQFAHGDGGAVILIVIGAVFTVSAVVSGSILVAGNTVHWIEQEGTCDDGKIKTAITSLSDSLSSVGGWVVTSSKQMLDWISFKKEQDETSDDILNETLDDAFEQESNEQVIEGIKTDMDNEEQKRITDDMLEDNDARIIEESRLDDESTLKAND